MTTLQALHLEKQYRGRKVVKNVSLRIDEGEIVGLLGPEWRRENHQFLHDGRLDSM